MKYCIFAYDWPHRKTCSFMRIMARERDPKDVFVIAAPWRALTDSGQEPPLITWPEEIPKTTPMALARQLKIKYYQRAHGECDDILQQEKPEIGIIAGARIIPKKVIDAFPVGILNLHGGILPLNRGLDCMKWAVYNMIPQGVTSHLIDEHVDAGRYIHMSTNDVWPTDEWADIAERQFQLQRKNLKWALPVLDNPRRTQHLETLATGQTIPHSRMPRETEKVVLERFDFYRKHYQDDIIPEWC